VSGALLVPTEHVAQPIAVPGKGVIEGHDRAAGNTEDDVDVFANQRLAHHLGAG